MGLNRVKKDGWREAEGGGWRPEQVGPAERWRRVGRQDEVERGRTLLLYTSDAADERTRVYLW